MIILIRLESEVYTVLAVLTNRPYGAENMAAVPTPSVTLFVPDPANVVTTRDVVILRILRPTESATNKVPEVSTSNCIGDENEAAVPTPSLITVLPEPAYVVTASKKKVDCHIVLFLDYPKFVFAKNFATYLL